MRAESDVVVVGGGLAGLAAAATAARTGARVTLVEARSELGGRARSTRAGRYTLNQGAHALYRSGQGVSVLRRLGIEPQGGSPDLSRAIGASGGRLGLLPAGPSSLLRSPWVSGRERVQLARVVTRIGRFDAASVSGQSFSQFMASLRLAPNVDRIVRVLARTSTYNADLDAVDAGAIIAATQSGLSGVIYLDRGWSQLIDGLRRAAGSVTVIHEKAIGIQRDHASYRVDLAAGGPVVADAIVVAAGAPATAARLLGDLDGRLHDRFNPDGAPPIRAACLDLGLRRLPVPDRRIVLALDSPLYLSAHTPAAALVDDSHAGEALVGEGHDGEVVHLLRYLTSADDGASAESLRSELESFADLAQPGWRPEVEQVRFERALVVSHASPSPGHRPVPIEVPGVTGVFLAGDWVGTGQLADASLSSGEAAGLAAVARMRKPVAARG